MYVDIVRLLIILSTYVLKMFIQLSKTDIKKSSDADWISMRLKEEIVIVLLIKLIFV